MKKPSYTAIYIFLFCLVQFLIKGGGAYAMGFIAMPAIVLSACALWIKNQKIKLYTIAAFSVIQLLAFISSLAA